jgi:ribosomal protein S18 acetylase RimI-like enzyme
MSIEFVEDANEVLATDLEGFFVAWPIAPSTERHLEILRESTHVVLARDGSRVVGFVTAISDSVFSAYIPLLEVLPEFQGRGIGEELMRRVLARLDGLYMIDLCCDAKLEEFYGRLGLRTWEKGMGLRNPGSLTREPGSRSEPGSSLS